MNRRRLILGCLAGSLLASGAVAQDDGEGPQGAFVDTLDVNVVNIEVFVTDKKGNPVTGLTRDDFSINEDGRPIQVTNFYAVADGQPVSEDGAKPDGDAADETRDPRLRLARIPEEQRLHVVVYVDNFNIEPFHRNRVFGQLRQFVRTLEPGTRVMLVSYDRSLNIRQRFTEDLGLVTAATFDLEKLSGGREQQNRERMDILKAIDRASSEEEDKKVNYSVLARIRQHSSSVQTDLRFTLDALRDTIESIAGLPGRKAVVYVSDGLPMVPGRDLFYHAQRKFEDLSAILESRQLDASREFQVLANQANSGGVTLYTIDASGLLALTSGNAENARASSVDGGGAFADEMNRDNLQASIEYLADRTGGTSIVNVNDVANLLGRVSNDFKTYYSLGYAPARAGDGRYHKVEVKVADKDLTVRHRDGYRDKPVAQRMKERTASSLRHGYQSNPLEIGVQVGQIGPHESGNLVVPFLIRIPLGKIVLVPREGAYEGRLQVFFTAMDEDGAVAPVQQDVISIQVPEAELEDARSKFYTYEARLLMRPGRHLFGAGVRDEYGASASFISAGVAPTRG
jgi:VWFA-related protein